MNITKLIHSSSRDDIILAVELMSKMDAEEIKKLFHRYQADPHKCWIIDNPSAGITDPLYKIHPRGILYIYDRNIYFTESIPESQAHAWGYKNMD